MKHYFETALPPVWTAVCAAAFGLLLAIYPALAGVIFAKIHGAAALFFALSRVVYWFRMRKFDDGAGRELLFAAVFLFLGLLCFLKPELLLSVFFFAIGVLLIVLGLIRIPLIVRQWSWGAWMRLTGILSTAVLLTLGLLLVAHPFGAAASAIRVFGVLLAIYGISDIFNVIIPGKYYGF